jgi:hypothetical protein
MPQVRYARMLFAATYALAETNVLTQKWPTKGLPLALKFHRPFIKLLRVSAHGQVCNSAILILVRIADLTPSIFRGEKDFLENSSQWIERVSLYSVELFFSQI